jgi:negative regulator of flagellin synthesis FlgM
MSISQLNAQERLRATMAAAALRSNAATAQPAASPRVRQPDGVSISAEARSLSAARQATTEAPELRVDRIAAIKAAIANGTYSVDSRDLATSLLRRAQDFGR